MTDNHEIDCSDRVELGRHAALAGFASQVLTHSLNLVTDRQTTGAVVLGDHCAVMSGCILQSGTNVPARAIISAGSVVTTRLTTEQRRTGNRAVRIPDGLRPRGKKPKTDSDG